VWRRQRKRQHIHAANFIQNQLHYPLSPAACFVMHRQRECGNNQLTQQRRDLHHLTAGGQIGACQRIDKQRARRDAAGNLQRMTGKRGQPDAAAWWHDPAAILRFHPHHAAQRVDQLCTGMVVPGLTGTVQVVVRQRHQRTMAEVNRLLAHCAFR